MMNNETGRHGCASDRGAADHYYGRGYCPHYYTPESKRVEVEDMTPAEIAAYKRGWDEETDRKQYD